MSYDRLYQMPFIKIYQAYLNKLIRKNHKEEALLSLLESFSGYPKETLMSVIKEKTVKDFFTELPKQDEIASQVTGVICGIRVELIKNTLDRRIRALDKLVDNLSKEKQK